MRSINKSFSTIYVEAAAQNYPLAQQVLQRFPKAEVIEIEDYASVFNRPRQNYELQKKSTQLILARKKDNFIYGLPNTVQSFGYRNFHYNALAFNCVYNCQYCYLQGMYPSAHMVLFVNEEDYFDATRAQVDKREDPSQPMHLSISYDTDLLAMENIAPYCQHWIEFARKTSDLVIEIRTKSGSISAIKDLEPHPGVILSWTLTPQPIADKYEWAAPSLKARLAAAKKAQEAGWQVRLCFDPVLKYEDTFSLYQGFFESVFSELDASKVRDASLGIFRMNHEFYENIEKRLPNNPITFQPWQREDKLVVADSTFRTETLPKIHTELEHYLPAQNITNWELL